MVREFDERNMARSRERCAAMAEVANTGKRVLTERERAILDMWPRFEDGEYLWFGDAYVDTDGDANEVQAVELSEACADLVGLEGFHTGFEPGERVERPAPKVLDADGVEIKDGDTVWHEAGSELHVIGFGDAQDGETMLVVEYAAGPTKWGEVRCLSVTHTRQAPKVLDADGAEIHVGDTVWYRGLYSRGFTHKATVTGFGEHSLDGPLATLKDEAGKTWHIDPKKITHVRPDSWERLEEDAAKHPCLCAADVKGSKFDSCSDCPWNSECEITAKEVRQENDAVASPAHYTSGGIEANDAFRAVMFAMRHAVKEYKADCHRYAERAFEDIDRARGLIEERSYFKAADALYGAVTDVHKAFLMGEIGLTYEKCAGWREEDGDRHADE